METQPKKKWPKKYGTRYEKVLILTISEGAQLESMLPQYSCANISQLCKRIVRGELEIRPKERAD